MQNDLSIVIISFNSEPSLQQVLQQAKKVCNNIIVVDSGSTDSTLEICKNEKVSLYSHKWEGYGKQKNYGNSLAKHNWILSLDADEVLSNNLVQELNSLSFKKNTVYSIPFINIYCGKKIRFGRWFGEKHIRLFNKTTTKWSTDKVHEGLTVNKQHIKTLKNPIYHYSMNSKREHLKKAKIYAQYGAEKLFKQNKKSGFIKRYVNPAFRFINDYIFKLGFLDGKEGFQIASIVSKETYWKYSYLDHLIKIKKK